MPTTTDLSIYIPATRIVLRTLKQLNATMHYGDFTRVIGLRGANEAWHVRYRKLVTDILDIAAQCDRTLEFDRLVKKFDGEPGSGFHKTSRIVKSR